MLGISIAEPNKPPAWRFFSPIYPVPEAFKAGLPSSSRLFSLTRPPRVYRLAGFFLEKPNEHHHSSTCH